MSKTTIQVPVNTAIKIAAEKAAHDQGFSSLQEALRIFMNQLSQKTISISFVPTITEKKLTKKQEATLSKKYKAARKAINHGNGYSFENVDDLTTFLRTT